MWTGKYTPRCSVAPIFPPSPPCNLDKLPAEAALDAKASARTDADNLSVLRFHSKIAAHAAVGTNRIDARLAGLIPLARLSHIVFALEHQRARGTYGDAV